MFSNEQPQKLRGHQIRLATEKITISTAIQSILSTSKITTIRVTVKVTNNDYKVHRKKSTSTMEDSTVRHIQAQLPFQAAPVVFTVSFESNDFGHVYSVRVTNLQCDLKKLTKLSSTQSFLVTSEFVICSNSFPYTPRYLLPLNTIPQKIT